MKKLIVILMLVGTATLSVAQDTAYVSQRKTTALFFNAAVKIIGSTPADFDVVQKESGLITLKAVRTNGMPARLNVQEIRSAKIYHISVEYSYGRAGRRMLIGQKTPIVARVIKSPEYNYGVIAGQLASGNRKRVVDHEKRGGVKAWVDKLSLAGNIIFFRLVIRNKSNLPYDVDFIRFYIRDLKTVARMATHEQEIVPVYYPLRQRVAIIKNQENASVFGFHRFSLSDDQALNVEVYERSGTRHLYLIITQKDLEDLKTINPASQRPANPLVAVHTIN